MSALTLFAGIVLMGAALPAPADSACPPDGEPYTVMTDYACSLSAWHRSAQQDAEPAAPPAEPPTCQPAG